MKTLFSAILLTLGLPLFAQVYTPQEAFQDLASERLTFLGREYPNADLGPGGNYVCAYKNSRIYLIHDGCRPNHTMKLTAFSAKIISRNGGSIHVYIEHNREAYRLEEAGPKMDGIWKLSAKNTPIIQGELSYRQVLDFDKKQNANYNTCWIAKDLLNPSRMPETKCIGDASDPQGTLEMVWHDPFSHGLKEAHDLILKAPRI